MAGIWGLRVNKNHVLAIDEEKNLPVVSDGPWPGGYAL
jgi:hypothetical protein